MKHKRTITETIEITYEYDDEHPHYFCQSFVDTTAACMTINPSISIEDGVRLLKVETADHESIWYIR